MQSIPSRFGLFLAAAGCCTLLACAAPEAPVTVTRATAVPDVGDELQGLYSQATDVRRRSVRKPIRDRRERAFDLLADKAEVLAREVQTWEAGAALTSEAPQADAAHAAAVELRESLLRLQAAARARSVVGTDRAYAQTTEDYRSLCATLDLER